MSAKEEGTQGPAEKSLATVEEGSDTIFMIPNVEQGRKLVVKVQDGVELSDGYHTMSELYEHRHALFIALCETASVADSEVYAWKSKNHSDGSPMYPGWFLAGLGFSKGDQITYHLPMRYWDDFKHEEVEVPPTYDGHTSDDILKRLRNFF